MNPFQEVSEFRARIQHLKKDSSYYPAILYRHYGEEIFASTLVRIQRDEVYYTVHCVESIVPNNLVTKNDLTTKLMWSAHNVQNLFIVTKEVIRDGFCDVDSSQEHEVDRLKKIINP